MSLSGEALEHETSPTPPLFFIEVPVRSNGDE